MGEDLVAQAFGLKTLALDLMTMGCVFVIGRAIGFVSEDQVELGRGDTGIKKELLGYEEGEGGDTYGEEARTIKCGISGEEPGLGGEDT